MSIDGYLVRITLQEIEELIQNPELASKFLGYWDEEHEGLTCVLGTVWQAIHYVLTREVAEPGGSLLPPPFCNIILGGKVIDEDGLIRCLTASEVKGVAELLKDRDVSWLEQECYKLEDKLVSIYNAPPIKNWKVDYFCFLLPKYESFRSLYLEAAKAGDGMLIWIG
jgi:hypothetical protein